MYLSFAARDEVATLAAEAEARMDEAAQRAKTDAEKSNDAILSAMEDLIAMGLDYSDQELAAELEAAMMEDGDYEAIQASSQPPVQESHFQKPSLSARTSKKRRASRQLGRDMKRYREGTPPKAPAANATATDTTSQSGARTVIKPHTRKLLAVPSFTLALRPKPKATQKSTGIGSRKSRAT